MAEGKWIQNLGPSMPLDEAAKATLEVRLQVVSEFLPLAVAQPDEDPEYVHQLRVGTRRAAAALDIFAPCLPEKVYRRARRRLRRLRRAAGDARDWDVFRISLTTEKSAVKKPGAGKDFLLGYCLGQRAAAQGRLAEAGADQERFQRLMKETLAEVDAPPNDHEAKVLVDLARPMLAGLLQEMNQAAGEDLSDYGKLHQVRIQGKRLRYAMEVFADCFWPPFREKLYPAVEDMQEILGRANDSHVAVGRLKDLREKLRVLPGNGRRFKAEIDRLIRLHQRRVPQEKRRFLAWWKQWQAQDPEAEMGVLEKNQK